MSDITIKYNEEEVIRIGYPEGYNESDNILRVDSEDMKERKEVIILNYPRASVPDTGTLGRLPFLLLSVSLILLSLFIRKAERS